MMGFFDFLLQSWYVFFAAAMFGLFVGLYASSGLSAKAKFCFCAVFILAFSLSSPLLAKYFEYTDYKENYQVCHSEEGKKNGYVFSENKCWKQSKDYVSLDSSVKTKEDLKIGK